MLKVLHSGDGIVRIISNKFKGFGLLEVLIAVVILSVGILGLASLQSRSIQSLQEGDNLATASMIANEMAQRMLSNPYMTAQGSQGYLLTDVNNAVDTAGGPAAWAASTLSTYPNIANCYSTANANSCFAPGADKTSSAQRIIALQNMARMDEVEMRLLAANALPDGEIKICFDSTAPLTDWDCDNVATQVLKRNENIYTIKVRWTNLFTNYTQMYVLQFTSEYPGFSPLITIANDLVSRSIVFSLTNTRFGSAYDLGYATSQVSGGFQGEVTTPSNIHPALTRVVIGDYSNNSPVNSGTACGALGQVWMGAEPSLLGFSPNIASGNQNVGINCVFFHHNGVVTTVCAYWYGTATVSQTTGLIPGWININTNSSWNAAAWGPALTAGGYFSSSCP
jgi:prepilin-type N-terminal cleavage/methylation domain-containing protein